ncbi:bifunctional folylpolyglutamate synthase/dihydrofolate synthase [Latilactobacillus sakei]|nr:Mur ligase family protein [Latilactobacillus sakei]SON73378.1 Dihydrofolate/folylpolyglutamate synthase [Latilactobacillus sakei]
MQDEEMVTQLPGMLYGEDERVTLLRQILKAMGQPDHAFSIIHVCGTNGKGSTSAMIAAILQASGYSVGLFTSPHIMAVEESIQINRQLISKAQFERLLATVQTVLKKLGFDPTTDLSYFETLVLVALVYFKQQQVDYVLWECGLGGELDATNAVDRVAYTLFTKISLDHMALLGDTIEAIATTKSKIIRPQTPVIVAPEQTKTALHVLEAEAKRQSALLQIAPRDWFVTSHPTSAGQEVTVKLPEREPLTVSLALAGTSYQLENLLTVLTWYRQFCRDQGHAVDEIVLQRALGQVRLPGRFERLATEPLVVIDGAHNPDGIRQFVRSVQERYGGYDLTIVTGFLKDKAVAECLQLLTQLPARFILTTPINQDDRQLPVAELGALYTQITGQTAPEYPAIEAALKAASQPATGNKPQVILVVGSFYLLKTVRQHFLS